YYLENGAVVGRQLLPGLRDGLSKRHAEPGNGRAVLSDGEVEVEVAVDLADGGPALNQNRSSRFAREELFGDVVLAHDIADQLLDQVLGGDQAGEAAVLVDHDGHLGAATLHFAQ